MCSRGRSLSKIHCEGPAPMTSTQMARRLTEAALRYRETGSDAALLELEALARSAAVHVRRAGQGTVDHIVLSGTLRLLLVAATPWHGKATDIVDGHKTADRARTPIASPSRSVAATSTAAPFPRTTRTEREHAWTQRRTGGAAVDTTRGHLRCTATQRARQPCAAY
jgi:hypothetical protein